VELEAARAFVRDHHRAILATTRHDGRPQLSPVTVDVDDDGLFVISSRETAYKVKNLARDPRASLCVFTGDFFGPWVQVDGSASLLHLPDAMEPLVGYYRRLSGEHPDWDDYRAAMVRDRRLLIRLAATAAGPDLRG
jgi:PPOX class probable F420-dependent enzyme